MRDKPEIKKRALRRHHSNRLKQRTRKVFKEWEVASEEMPVEETDRMVGKFHNNLAKCSCDLCCNPRKHGEKTLQERKIELSSLDEWGEDTRIRKTSSDDESRLGW